MSAPFVAEIRVFACNFAPTGWALCNGQLLPISQNTALFSLIGTMYGGNGQTTFALPNLQGSAAIHSGQGPGLTDYLTGETGGAENVTLIASELPAHTHALRGRNNVADLQAPGPTRSLARSVGGTAYTGSLANPVQMAPEALPVAGAGLPHTNMPPVLVFVFCIALQGVFPPRP